MMFSAHDLYKGSFQEKLAKANTLFESYSIALLGQNQIREALASLAQLACALKIQMASLDLAKLCIECGGKGGGCCSVFMAGEADAVLLLINLLAGCNVDIQRDDGVECYLLGPQGCALFYKPMFCLNYNCSGILSHGTASQLKELETAAGKLLQQQYGLEQMVLAFFQRLSMPTAR